MRTTSENCAQKLQALARHRAVSALWGGAAALLLVSVKLDNHHIGRTAVILALIATSLVVRDVGRHIVSRHLHHLDCFLGDVVIPSERSACSTIDLAHRRRRRDAQD